MMRVLLYMLGTLLCIAFSYGAWEEDFKGNKIPDPLIPDHLLLQHWNSAEKEYRENYANVSTNNNPHAKTTPVSEEFEKHWNVYSIYSEKLAQTHNISKRQAASTSNPSQCVVGTSSNCAGASTWRYRNFDGSCNNLNNPGWGSSNRAFNRLLQPSYDDGFNSPRGGLNSRLPNARLVSVSICPDSNAVAQRVTNMVPQFGQFLDHDITLTPQQDSQCCSNPSSNANCWAINVSQDAFYRGRTQCLDFTRSTPCLQNGVRQQMNMNTAYIDGGQIYGSTVQRANQLRSFTGGMLRTHPNFRGFLPLKGNVGVTTNGDFAAGDDRINEMPALAVMHNVWIMEHNRIASAFQRLTSWNDERIFQEARRIVIAELQQVTYSEYLPSVLGPDAINEYNLNVATWSSYNQNVDATITNEFATAAYRFGHSLVAGIVQLFTATNQAVDSYQVANEYFQSRQITRDNGQGYDMILRGLMRQNAPDMDRFVTSGVTNFLFKSQTANFGSDLVARNVQRGRDHGLRSYNDYRVNCGGSDLTNANWNTIPPGINADGWRQASAVYSRPADIDLFIGGLIENAVPGGLTGQTFTCLIGLQFQRLKFGDRHFFTHNNGLGSSGFTGPQLTDISRRTLGDIICDNSQQPNTQYNVFMVEGGGNSPINCVGSGRNQLNFNNFL